MAKKQFNRRLSDEAISAITFWAKQDSTPSRPVTDTEIVEQAIAMYDGMRTSGGEVSATVITELSGLPTDAMAVKAAVALASSTDSKYLRPNGQPMNYFERQAVDRREHLASVAASDKTGTGRDDIEYDPQS